MEKIFYRLLFTFGLSYFAFALLLPATRWDGMLNGTDFEKLEREPLVSLACLCWTLCLVLLRGLVKLRHWKIEKRGLWLISISALLIATLVAYFGHIGSSALLLILTAVQFNERKPIGKA